MSNRTLGYVLLITALVLIAVSLTWFWFIK
jgi:hypothetical protein